MVKAPAIVLGPGLRGDDMRHTKLLPDLPCSSMLAAWRDAVKIAGWDFCTLVAEEAPHKVHVEALAVGDCYLKEARCE